MDKIERVVQSPEYKKITNHYGAACAQRSGVMLLNHINEGLAIMDAIDATEDSMRAFALHPILQSDEALPQALSFRSCPLNDCSVRVVVLAMEYRRAANAYLCRPDTDSWDIETANHHIGLLLPEIRDMLIADKVQNRKDFVAHHLGTHERSAQLLNYFNNWHTILNHPLPVEVPA